MPLRRILMPTDGSPCSEKAIRDGLPYARALDAEVTFLYALEDPTAMVYAAPGAISYQPHLYKDLARVAREALQRAEALAAAVGVPCKSLLVERQHPVAAIHAAEKDVDLVMMGTHGRRGFERYLLGSVAENALHGASKPYLMFRCSDPETAEGS